jgi:hypothetical protein
MILKRYILSGILMAFERKEIIQGRMLPTSRKGSPIILEIEYFISLCTEK